jgi:predicted alpha/beta superfamily hydrolase
MIGSRVAAALAAVCLAGCAAQLPSGPPATSAVVPLKHLPALAGHYFPIRSLEAQHLYHIYVRLPQGYEEAPERRYPVVYLLDGDGLFPVIGGNHIFLTIDDKLPEAIVVGIAYGGFTIPPNRRHIDFMPPGPQVKPGESRIDEFHRFLERELLPAVESRYRADPSRRILFGQSRGGALILYSAFKRPDLFWARIASNPSWVPGADIFYGTPAPAARRDLQLIVAVGSDEYPDRRVLAGKWFDHWSARRPPWKLSRVDIAGGTHSADAGSAYRAGLRLLFPTAPAAPPTTSHP